MENMKNFILDCLQDGEEKKLEVNKAVSIAENNKHNVQAEKILETSQDFENDDVPIYTAEQGKIEYWHACVNIHVLDFLRLYDLDRGTIAFDAFKIGVDEQKHSATFALDDTHFLKFELNDTNVRPMDEAQAEKVLQKVNSLRFEKNKKYPYRRVRKW